MQCESAGIGRQARLRCVWQQSCEFKSHLSHQRNRVKKFRKKLLNVVFLFVLPLKDCGLKCAPVPRVLFGCYGLKNSRFDEKPAPNPERVFAVFGQRVSNLDTGIWRAAQWAHVTHALPSASVLQEDRPRRRLPALWHRQTCAHRGSTSCWSWSARDLLRLSVRPRRRRSARWRSGAGSDAPRRTADRCARRTA